MNACQSPDATTESSRSALSTHSSHTAINCRICQDINSSESLIKPCECSGTIGLVHGTCLEKWLSRSARETCELCHYKFKTTKNEKSFREFIRRHDFPNFERHYIIADVICFLVLTPLGLASSYLCLRGAHQYYNSDDFWAGFALILLSTFLTMLYMFWMSIAIRYHYRTFKGWQKENINVKVIFSDKQLNVTPKLTEIKDGVEVNFKDLVENRSDKCGDSNVIEIDCTAMDSVDCTAMDSGIAEDNIPYLSEVIANQRTEVKERLMKEDTCTTKL